MRILITGASGSGTSTLAEALANELGVAYLDTDDYYWLPTEPPFQQKRDGQERFTLLLNELKANTSAVVAGSVMDWGDELENIFDLIVFLYLDTKIRLECLQRREIERYGQADPEFLALAAKYDLGVAEGRSLPRHMVWLSVRTCPVLKLDGDMSVADRLVQILNCLPENQLSNIKCH